MTFGVVASSYPLSVTDYATEVLADSPVAYWRMGQASGGAIDSSGNGYDSDATVNVPTAGATGLLVGDSDTACDFTASSSEAFGWLDAAWMDTLDSITIEAWVKPETLQGSGVRYIVSRWNATAADRHFRLESFYDSGSVYFRCYLREGTTNIRMDSTTTLTAGNTYHLVATYNESTGAYALYVNGTSEASGTNGGGGALNDAGSPGRIAVGAVYDAASYSQFWDGIIDEVALYDAPLSSARISAHYAAGT